MFESRKIIIIGAGLAGVEAAWQLAGRGIRVRLFEAKPKRFSPAHRSENFAELVCSNSLKSEEGRHATALLKDEMRALGSLVLEAADATRLPAGKALAVDRELFSKFITDKICSHRNIEVVRREVESIDEVLTPHPTLSPEGRGGGVRGESRITIIATGPLTSPSFADSLKSFLIPPFPHGVRSPPAKADEAGGLFDVAAKGPDPKKGGMGGLLYFYDAIAPTVEADGIDMKVSFRASRYGVGKDAEGDYINCPLTKDEYYRFIEALLKADRVNEHEFDSVKYFEGCMPIEAMAGRHPDALRHGPMRPMGLYMSGGPALAGNDPTKVGHPGLAGAGLQPGRNPYAVVQLRQDNLHATLYNMVGFQTRLKYPEQERVFRMIPGLEHAKFARLGSMHRNTYINGPLLLDERLQLKSHPGIYIAGQLTGVEGYLESAATGLYVGLMCCHPQRRGQTPPVLTSKTTRYLRGRRRRGLTPSTIPPTTAIGALIHHITHADPNDYQPMNILWGLFPPPDGCPSTSKGPRSEARRAMLISRARADFKAWFN